MASPDILTQGFQNLLRIKGETMQVVDDVGTEIEALLTVSPSISPAMIELGTDPRELAQMIVLAPAPKVTFDGVQRDLALNDFLIQESANQKWQAIRRTDNPADFTTEFWLKKVVAGIDL